MNCSNCGHEVSSGDNTCPFCDADLGYAGVWSESKPAEGDDLHGVIAGLQAQVSRLQAQMIRQGQRIDALENAGPRLARERPPIEATGQATGPVEAPAGTAQAPAAQQDAPTATPPADEKRGPSSRDWEWLVGGNWLARVGILALIIGIGFFLKMAFDNDWMGETERVV